ncbi:hypothetical protein SUGI_0505910 [Cryptomeria japonica]|nr:hypothetical protein SUGI_0505910 [Cryptomeria japonica]
MDWFAWLSQTDLEPSLVYEYGLLFAQNEVEEEDMNFFNHDFLQSMGIGVAKHRLEILKLAKREGGRAPYVHRLFASLKKTNRRVRTFVHAWIQNRPIDPALFMVPSKVVYRGHHNGKGFLGCFPALAPRNKMLIASRDTKSPLRLKASSTPEKSYSCRTTPLQDNQLVVPANAKDIWWASMFEDLKPT